MMTNRKYIIVDDDPFNNILSNLALEAAFGAVDIKTFSRPEEGLAYIAGHYPERPEPTILFLDINMPTLTAWEFLEEFEKFSTKVKEQFQVYILSSSVDHRDKDKAIKNKLVRGFISKPLEKEAILELLET
jgi:response regulator RpfG family c-di-GMP phosphodiesterase